MTRTTSKFETFRVFIKLVTIHTVLVCLVSKLELVLTRYQWCILTWQFAWDGLHGTTPLLCQPGSSSPPLSASEICIWVKTIITCMVHRSHQFYPITWVPKINRNSFITYLQSCRHYILPSRLSWRVITISLSFKHYLINYLLMILACCTTFLVYR